MGALDDAACAEHGVSSRAVRFYRLGEGQLFVACERDVRNATKHLRAADEPARAAVLGFARRLKPTSGLRELAAAFPSATLLPQPDADV